jgi:hypothetical protein
VDLGPGRPAVVGGVQIGAVGEPVLVVGEADLGIPDPANVAWGAWSPMKLRPPSVVRRSSPHGGFSSVNVHGAWPSIHQVSSLIAVNDWGEKLAGIGIPMAPGAGLPGIVLV